MFDTNVTIVGTVLTAPEWRRTRNATLVASFRVASRSRRFDREQGVWTDGDSLRVRVTCWRRLAESVLASVMVGDPVIVTGRLYTRDWQTATGERRLAYELEALAVGHDLSRGQGSFTRYRAAPAAGGAVDGPIAAAGAGVTGEWLPGEPVPGAAGWTGAGQLDDDRPEEGDEFAEEETGRQAAPSSGPVPERVAPDGGGTAGVRTDHGAADEPGMSVPGGAPGEAILADPGQPTGAETANRDAAMVSTVVGVGDGAPAETEEGAVSPWTGGPDRGGRAASRNGAGATRSSGRSGTRRRERVPVPA